MRLWSLHPRYLDPQGLVALWREALLARAVLRGETVGYTRHPQLERFRAHPTPRRAIDAYLAGLHAEATARGYAFDRGKFRAPRTIAPLAVSDGQVRFEWEHLLDKLAVRDPARHAQLHGLDAPDCHPLFRVDAGPVASWERAADDRAR
jgi:hypothetical protein